MGILGAQQTSNIFLEHSPGPQRPLYQGIFLPIFVLVWSAWGMFQGSDFTVRKT